MDIKKFMRPNILALAPYSTARDEYQGGEIGVFLDANENPFDTGYNRYPDPHLFTIKERLSEIKGVEPSQIFVGNGSDEAIDLLFRVFCTPGLDNAVSIAPSYGMYKVAAAINDVEIREVQLRSDYTLDSEAVLGVCDEKTKLIWLCSPNNPSGNLLCIDEVEKILTSFNGMVVIDEAYIDFCNGGVGFLPKLSQYPNLVVLQTLSKAWGMAGLRLGMAFASADLISIMNNVKYPYNINITGQQKVLELLENCDEVAEQCKTICSQRERVIKELEANSNIEKIFPTDANFVLIKVADATALYNYLVENGIIVRNRTSIRGCEGTLRLTIGREDENDKLLEAIDNYEW